MSRRFATGPALRALAIVIAIAGVVDPAVTSTRASKPNVAVLAADARRDSALADRVAQTLEKRFSVYRTTFPAADATVIVGDRVPAGADASSAPAFAVIDDRTTPAVSLDAVRAPTSAPAASRVAIDADVRTRHARGRTVDVTLSAGNLVVDRAKHTILSDDERVPVTLSFVPPSAGAAPLRVAASVGGASDSAAADVVVDVRDARWSILFFDARPSWMSTFVRRAAESDPRFVVTSRIVTSRNLSAAAGQPPSRLDDLVSLGAFDAVVVGAPEALSERDVAGLETFLRRRGGSVVLLLDHRASGAFDRLTGVSSWIADSASRSLSIIPVGDTIGLRVSEIAFPVRLPETARALALTNGARADSLNGRAAVWRTSVGAGRVIVSGALDSWRYRDRAVSAFDRFWQMTIADAASASPPPVDIAISNRVLRPGERTEVEVAVRDAALRGTSPVRVSAAATLESDSLPPVTIDLAAEGTPGRFRGVVRAPDTPGLYRVSAASGGERKTVSISVMEHASRPTPADDELVTAWVGARKGRVITASHLDELPAALTDAVQPPSRAEVWHPMRSPWWIVPFALALSTEWWMRRRRGLQ